MSLQDYGWSSYFKEVFKTLQTDAHGGTNASRGCDVHGWANTGCVRDGAKPVDDERLVEYKPAIVICHYSNYYDVICEYGRLSAELSGGFKYKAGRNSDFPAVGDWVLIDPYYEEKKAVIHELLPRKSCFSRKAPDGKEDEQVIAANIDILCIVSGLDNNFNPNRIERYVTQAYDSGAAPLIILNKVDLITSRDTVLMELRKVVIGVNTVFLSTITEKESRS